MTVLIETAAHNPWEFGWEAAVAITTGLLAFFTWRLAARTRELAQETADDQRAQWRPLLLPVGEWEERSRGRITYPRGIRYTGDTLRVRIRNSGRGPALHVRARLDLDGDRGSRLPADWSLGALEAENIKWLRFANAPIGNGKQARLLIDYQDMANRHHVTASIIKRRADGLFLHAVEVLEDYSVTALGDAAYPQECLQDVVEPVKKHKGWRQLLGPLLVSAVCGVGFIFILLFTHGSC
ncbi:hypothetical protein GCM10022403_038990 [Streptomyces coacervatus]|uniref:RING-type E3 ubiquitin transferase n=1 Tax=Streptomyces coacervatus TaxID=647381 RepID=A0ABP7HP35_9ACTN|nr:hypothetical protein [Streptomyces coacervatus]MDF2270694.1 hypothetical protein [Streptomyces coacervatus]